MLDCCKRGNCVAGLDASGDPPAGDAHAIAHEKVPMATRDVVQIRCIADNIGEGTGDSAHLWSFVDL